MPAQTSLSPVPYNPLQEILTYLPVKDLLSVRGAMHAINGHSSTLLIADALHINTENGRRDSLKDIIDAWENNGLSRENDENIRSQYGKIKEEDIIHFLKVLYRIDADKDKSRGMRNIITLHLNQPIIIERETEAGVDRKKSFCRFHSANHRDLDIIPSQNCTLPDSLKRLTGRRADQLTAVSISAALKILTGANSLKTGLEYDYRKITPSELAIMISKGRATSSALKYSVKRFLFNPYLKPAILLLLYMAYLTQQYYNLLTQDQKPYQLGENCTATAGACDAIFPCNSGNLSLDVIANFSMFNISEVLKYCLSSACTNPLNFDNFIKPLSSLNNTILSACCLDNSPRFMKLFTLSIAAVIISCALLFPLPEIMLEIYRKKQPVLFSDDTLQLIFKETPQIQLSRRFATLFCGADFREVEETVAIAIEDDRSEIETVNGDLDVDTAFTPVPREGGNEGSSLLMR
ncbi:MAG: hypothetical protein NTZ67_05230 [Gammaproteobacteria bacterium]|nr:hypothetical protein [Gammaproteobacteria bacterium]